MGLDTVVVVPARDEADRIGQCLTALAAQTLARERFAVVVVADACSDDTKAVASRTGDQLGLALTLIDGPGRGSGPARRAGMDLAARRLLGAGRPDGLIASTDADTRPHDGWLAAQWAHLGAGAQVIAGRIELDPGEARTLGPVVLAERERRAGERLRRVLRDDPGATHHHFAGASIGVTASIYAQVGGMPPLPDLEDEGFFSRLRSHRITVLRPADVVVTTSARTDGRATRGLSADLARALRETGPVARALTPVTQALTNALPG